MPGRSTRSLAVINTMPAGTAEFDAFITSHLEPLAKSLTGRVAKDNGVLVQTADVAADGLIVRLENDRGLLTLQVSPGHTRRFWAMDDVAKLFPPVRTVPWGNQRLTLTEQFALLNEHWQRLRAMFEIRTYSDTAQILAQAHGATPKRADDR